jgi:hypothetical protein
MQYPHRFFLSVRYPSLDEWCIRKTGERESLCGLVVTSDVAGVNSTKDQLLHFEQVCDLCRAICIVSLGNG